MTEVSAKIIPANVAGTLDGLFRERVRIAPDDVAYQYFDRGKNDWQSLTWNDMAKLVSRWQQALIGEDLQPNDRVAILLPNCPEWVAFEQAALGIGLVAVPLYCDDRPDNLAYILNDSGCKVLFIQTDKQWRALSEQKDNLPHLNRIVILQAKSESVLEDDERIVLAKDWLPDAAPLRERGGDPHKLASIVYTSGTTGRPKGVMLSHYNMLSIADAAINALEIDHHHQMLSFLPLSHTFERTCGYYVPMMCGASVAYSRSIQQLAEDLSVIKPTALISVPRIFERIFEKVQSQLKKESFIKRFIFNSAINVGWRRFEIQQGRGRRSLSLLFWPLLYKLVASKIQSKLGGNLQLAVSGGAALPPKVARTFIGLGINVIQGYGMTETSPILTANLFKHNDPASVGRALPCVELKVGENDELLAKSPGVMLGYWNNHKATNEMIGSDGWLHTGDKAAIRDGYVYITGRIKDILVMSNGEKIPPGDMELAISLDPLFEQNMIIGEGQAYLGAIVVINSEEWFTLAKEHGLDPFDEASLQNKKLHSTLLRHIADALHDFPGYAKVRRVLPLLEEWTVDNGILTPTLKVKRPKVLERYAKQIENMYAE